MKNLKRLGAVALTATMALGVTAFDIAPDVQPIYVPGLGDLGIAAISAELPQYESHFESFTGTIVGIEQEGTHVLVQNEDGDKVMFVINHNTFFTGEIEVGTLVTGHHIVNPNMAVPAIWPPHNTARVIEVIADCCESVVVDRFTMIDEWTFESENLTLNINENTPVLLQNGEEVYLPDVPGMTLSQVLDGRKLVVTYNLANRMMPPGTIPADPALSVVVLFEEAVHLPGMGLDLGFDFGGYDYYQPGEFFLPYSGTITAIETGEYGYKLTLTSEEYGSMTLLTNFNTHVLGELEVGGTIRAYYPLEGAMIMIYPPQHTARFINATETQATFDRFEMIDEFTFASENLMLNINEDTPVLLQDGTQVYIPEGMTLSQVLDGRKLVVTHSMLNRMLPGGTIPADPYLTVTVLFETAVALPGGLSLEPFLDLEFYNYGISVNGRMVDALWQQVDGAFYVPFRAVVNLLGFGSTVSWDNDTRQITVSNGTDSIAFAAGSNQFTVGNDVVELVSPALILNDRAYVPFNFFSQVFGMNNAYMHAGQIFINNDEQMQ